MGANYGKYCTCCNKDSQTQEASLSRKEYYPIHNADNPDNIANTLKPQLNFSIVSELVKPKKTPAKSSMSSDSTDRIEHSSILIQKIDYPNGDQYIGKVTNNKRESKGKLTFKKGGYYEGDFHDDLYEGYGTLWTENTVYYGYFASGEKFGNGKLENKIDGTEYIGHWEHNLKNGYGKETYSDGSFFEGNYVNGMKNGQGFLSLSNRLQYNGEFVNDNIEGQGTFIWNDKKEYTGNWKGNNLSGFGILTQEKDKHIGYFDNDRKNGLGLNYFHKSKSFLISSWIDDSVKGLAIFINPNQEKQLWQMEENKLVHYYNTNEEIQKILNSKEYQLLKHFFLHLRTNNLIDDLKINGSFSL